MAVTQTIKRLSQQVLTGSSATLYTVPASTVTNLRDIFVTNITAGAVTYTLYLVASGDSPAIKNTIISARSLAANSTEQWRVNSMLATGDTIRGYAASPSSIVVQASGIESVGTFLKTTPKRLVQAELGNASTTLYTVPASTSTIVKDMWLCNASGSSRTVTVDLVKSGGSVGDASKVYAANTLAANTTLGVRCSLVMETGDTLRAHADSTGAIGFNVSGVEWNTT